MKDKFVSKLTKSSMVICALLTFIVGMGWNSKAEADPFIGQIETFGFNFAPRGWALCNGQLLAISSNTALFSLFGTFYGGDGRTTFALPDCRGRVMTHFGSGPGLTPRSIGQRFGQENVTLTENQIPSHNHTATTTSTLMATDTNGTTEVPTGNVLADDGNDRIYSNVAPNVAMNAAAIVSSTTIGNTGGSQSHTNVQPTLVINWSVALTGIFPSRN